MNAKLIFEDPARMTLEFYKSDDSKLRCAFREEEEDDSKEICFTLNESQTNLLRAFINNI